MKSKSRDVNINKYFHLNYMTQQTNDFKWPEVLKKTRTKRNKKNKNFKLH